MGDYFGELALKYNIPEPYSTICMEDGWLGYLERDDFDSILLKFYHERLNGDVKFLSEISIFEGMKPPELEQIFFICEIINLKKDSVIYKEKDKDSSIYIIREGSVEVKTNQKY
jgi:CRP-like cAMP-binding protein